jgi:hypothetical protein
MHNPAILFRRDFIKALMMNMQILQFRFKAITHKTAISMWTLTAGSSKTRLASLSHLNSMY